MIEIYSRYILKDGGSEVYATNKGEFRIDNRIHSKTKGAAFRGAMIPENMVLEGERVELLSAVAAYKKSKTKQCCGVCGCNLK